MQNLEQLREKTMQSKLIEAKRITGKRQNMLGMNVVIGNQYHEMTSPPGHQRILHDLPPSKKPPLILLSTM
jgi:hypothetical protein